MELKNNNVNWIFIVLNVHKIDGTSNLYSRCIGCGFKMFAAIDEENISDLLKGLILL